MSFFRSDTDAGKIKMSFFTHQRLNTDAEKITCTQKIAIEVLIERRHSPPLFCFCTSPFCNLVEIGNKLNSSDILKFIFWKI